jgi:hypothetical protein
MAETMVATRAPSQIRQTIVMADLLSSRTS